ncbi:MAG: 3-hydroxyacyl-CoA dehydrogenase family protein, partial [Alphaproteobacteria bacterium]
GATGYDSLAEADIVIEAVFEDMDVKRDVFAALDAATRPDAILATNTSYLDVNAISRTVREPSRVVGLHFFSPAHVMKLLEIVRPEAVADDVLATGFALARDLGKQPVVAGVCDGFIGNRILARYRQEADFMLEEGALPWQIDRAMEAWGFAMGLYRVQDLAGLDIAWAMRKRRAATRDPAARYVRIADRLCEMGRFGQKTGAGWYRYDSGRAEPDPEVERIILEESARAGIARRAFDDEEIIARLLGVMKDEGRAILDEGIAARASDIDVVLVNGYGFPRWRGGPMFLAGMA